MWCQLQNRWMVSCGPPRSYWLAFWIRRFALLSELWPYLGAELFLFCFFLLFFLYHCFTWNWHRVSEIFSRRFSLWDCIVTYGLKQLVRRSPAQGHTESIWWTKSLLLGMKKRIASHRKQMFNNISSPRANWCAHWASKNGKQARTPQVQWSFRASRVGETPSLTGETLIYPWHRAPKFHPAPTVNLMLQLWSFRRFTRVTVPGETSLIAQSS